MHVLIATASFAAPVYAPDIGELVQAVTVVTGAQALTNRTEFLSASLDGYHTDRSVQPNVYLTTNGITASYLNTVGFGNTVTSSLELTPAGTVALFTSSFCTSGLTLGANGNLSRLDFSDGTNETKVDLTPTGIDVSISDGATFKTGIGSDTSLTPLTEMYSRNLASTVQGLVNTAEGQVNLQASSGSLTSTVYMDGSPEFRAQVTSGSNQATIDLHANSGLNASVTDGSTYSTGIASDTSFIALTGLFAKNLAGTTQGVVDAVVGQVSIQATDSGKTASIVVNPTQVNVDCFTPGFVNVAVGSGTQTVTTNKMVLQFTGILAGDITVSIAVFNTGQLWVIDAGNVTFNGHTITVEPSGHSGNGVILNTTGWGFMYCDNTPRFYTSAA